MGMHAQSFRSHYACNDPFTYSFARDPNEQTSARLIEFAEYIETFYKIFFLLVYQ